MEKFVVAAQVLIAGAVSYVWIFRFENIVREFPGVGEFRPEGAGTGGPGRPAGDPFSRCRPKPDL